MARRSTSATKRKVSSTRARRAKSPARGTEMTSRSRSTVKRGFAAMSPQRRRSIAAKGGRARRAAA